MREEAAFLQAIADNPSDATARLVFADWLEERGDVRATWVRDADLWEVMKPDARNPTENLLAAVRRQNWRGGWLLGKMGPPVVPAILAALRGAEERATSSLQAALEVIGPSAGPALSVLLEAVKDADPRVRLGAFRCLSGLMLKADEALRVVLTAVGGADEVLCGFAMSACSKVAEQPGAREKLLPVVPVPLVPLLVPMLAGRDPSTASYVLRDLGVPAVRAILASARDLTGNATSWAEEVLRGMGREAVPVLREALAAPEVRSRQLAAQVLAFLPEGRPPDALPALIEGLQSVHPEPRRRALESLERLGPAATPAIPALLGLASDEKAEPNDRSLAARALARIGPEAMEPAVPTLLRLVARRDSFIPTALVHALNAAGHGPSGVLVLLKASRSLRAGSYDWVEQNLHNTAIGAAGDLTNLRDLILRAYRERGEGSTLTEPACLALSKAPARAVAAVRPFLADPSPATRVVAVWALRHVGTTEAAAALLGALKDRDRVVRVHAVRALGKVGAGVSGVAEALRAALGDRAQDVRTAAEAALRAQGAGSG